MKKTVSKSQNRKPRATACEIIIQELKDEVLIYRLAVDKAVCLNPTAAFIWKKCDGQTSVADISRQLARAAGQPVNEDIVWLTLDLLEKEELIDQSDLTAFHFNNLSRREIIGKVGLATLIMLPTISLLAVPSAAAAQSGTTTPSNGACSSDCSTVLGGVCACLGSIACAPGTTLGAALGVGVCVNVSIAVNAGINVSGGANGNVCLFTSACLTI